MKKGNKYRILFWGIIMIILCACSIIGLIFLNKGYGIEGKTLIKLKPIVETFNNLNDIKRYNAIGIKINSQVKNKKIIIKYKSANNSYATFEYKYELINNEEYLINEFNTQDKEISNIVLKYMADAVSVLNGYKENELYTVYTFDELEKLSLHNGIEIKTQFNITTVKINLSNPILKKYYQNNTEYFTKLEIKESLDKLSNTNEYVLEKDEINLKIKIENNLYIADFEFKNNNIDNKIIIPIKYLIELVLDENIAKEFIYNYNELKDYENELYNIKIDNNIINIKIKK